MKKKTRYGFEIWRLIYPILIYFGINIVVTYIYLFAAAFGMAAGGILDPMELASGISQLVIENTLVITIISNFASLVIFFLLFNGDKKKEKKNCEYVKYEKSIISKWILVVILGICAALSLNIIIPYFLELIKYIFLLFGIEINFSGFEAVSEIIYGSSIFIQILATVISAPLVEEFLVRGLIYKRMKKWSKPIVAAIVSSALFGLIHMNFVQFVYAFLIGMILALVYEKFENIWAPILFHLSANAISILISNSSAIVELFESDIIVIIIGVVTTIAMVVLIIYFVKSEKARGMKIEDCAETLKSQLEVQEKEKQMYS